MLYTAEVRRLSSSLPLNKNQVVHFLCIVISMELGRTSPWARGEQKERGIVTCEQAGNDPDSPGSLEQTRRCMSLSPTSCHYPIQSHSTFLSLSALPPCPPPPPPPLAAGHAEQTVNLVVEQKKMQSALSFPATSSCIMQLGCRVIG